ncbi:hypothetical protein CUR178_08504 [Leishmania enriettii]|uniref:Uncharacterized protein n=1 Tax=Leishmania enriettii TaxID=5663 RepID=A0A836L3L0_LEIEN|nr:hypothetical protein CUR178_08504 [Leishmania enriettii]
MPGVDLLDAFAELVVRVVFSLPHTEPEGTPSSDEDVPYRANSSTTQIFSRTNSLEDEQSQQLLNDAPLGHLSMSNSTRIGSGACHSTMLETSCSNSISRGSSAASLDLYPGGIWNALARVPAVNGGRSSLPSSVVSLGTGDNVSTPRSGAGLWNRFLGGSSRTYTPPRTGMTTTASSFVQLTDEELGVGAAASSGGSNGGVGAAHSVGGSGVLVGFSMTPATGHSNASTPLRDTHPLPSSSSNSNQQLPQQQPSMGSHGLYICRSPTQSGSGNGGRPSQRSSSSEFDIL